MTIRPAQPKTPWMDKLESHFKDVADHMVDTHFQFDVEVSTDRFQEATNVYMDLNGIIHPRTNPTAGLWRFDGCFFIPPTWKPPQRPKQAWEVTIKEDD
jgi:hypothetical protein